MLEVPDWHVDTSVLLEASIRDEHPDRFDRVEGYAVRAVNDGLDRWFG